MQRSTLALLLLSLAGLLASAGHAQTSVYAHIGPAAYGQTNPNSNNVVLHKDTVGFGGGVFYDFAIQSRVTVGLDARLAASPGTGGGFLAGGALRVGLVPHRNPLRPYFQIGAGVVHTANVSYLTYPAGGGLQFLQTSSITSGAAQFLLGLDIRLNDRFDLRAPELGAEAGGGSGLRADSSFLNVGLVYHVKPLRR